jgi:hypothetical protein
MLHKGKLYIATAFLFLIFMPVIFFSIGVNWYILPALPNIGLPTTVLIDYIIFAIASIAIGTIFVFWAFHYNKHELQLIELASRILDYKEFKKMNEEFGEKEF